MTANIKYLYDKGTTHPTIDELDSGEYFVLVGDKPADRLLLMTENGPVFAGNGRSLEYDGDELVRRVNVSIEVTAA